MPVVRLDSSDIADVLLNASEIYRKNSIFGPAAIPF
jgi:hypothetical protein